MARAGTPRVAVEAAEELCKMFEGGGNFLETVVQTCSVLKLVWRGMRIGGSCSADSAYTPLLLEGVDDPGGRPEVIALEGDEKVCYLFSLGWIGHQWSPDEDCVAHCD